MTAAEANTALEYYRERFARVGMYENSVYDGIPELLQNLRQAGKTLAVATSKPQLYAEKILEHFGLAAHFSTIAGPGFNGELPTKADVISEVLQRLHLTAADKNAAVMLGDREHDAIGAQQINLHHRRRLRLQFPGRTECRRCQTNRFCSAGFCRLFIMIYF